ncbi:MAG: NAD(P)/FAD-dependent oxidoreductase [Gemmatimonadaceae bacterium]
MGPRILIIGAGPTGIGAAWRLVEHGHDNWLLVDAADHAGGLASSAVDAAGFTWDHGGHVLFSHYRYFDRLMTQALGDAWVEHEREAWVWIKERWVPYPFQNNLWRLPPEDVAMAIDGLVAAAHARTERTPENFREWLLQSFGRGLCDLFMLPYNRKVWAYDPAALDVGWMGERVAKVDVERVKRNVELKRDDAGWGPNATFRFPLHGGTGAIWRSLHRQLPAERVMLGRRAVSVDSRAHTVLFADGSDERYDHLVSTMPLDHLLSLLTEQPVLQRLAGRFVHSSSHIVGVGFEGPVPDALRTKCWMYFPEPNTPFYRATVFSNYSPNNVPRPGEQWSLMAEVSESPEKPVDSRTVVDEVIAGFRAARLIDPDTRIASRWNARLEHGYPTPWLGRDDVLAQVEPVLAADGIYSRGRFGAWKYEVSNQDHSAMQGVEAVDNILLGTVETTISGRMDSEPPSLGAEARTLAG